MITIAIPSTPIVNRAGGESSSRTDGQVLGDFLRALADRVDETISILPVDGSPEWTPVTHRFATRLDGALVGGVIELEA